MKSLHYLQNYIIYNYHNTENQLVYIPKLLNSKKKTKNIFTRLWIKAFDTNQVIEVNIIKMQY